MKIGVTIFLLILLVSIQTPMGQLFKLPVFVEHFIKHQQKESVSFINFLQDHYATDHDDDDLPEDNQLPFKTMSLYSIGYAIVPNAICTDVVHALRVDKKVIFSLAYTSQLHLVNIFHPPRT